MQNSKIWMTCISLLFLCTAIATALAQDPGWPRQIARPGGTLTVYQPQVDEWNNYTELKWRMAFQLTPTGGKQVVGALSATASTQANTDTHMVFLYNIHIDHTYFPGEDPGSTAQLDQLVRSFMPPTLNVSLERIVAYMPKPQSLQPVAVKNDPPRIFVSYTPAILLGVDGDPVLADFPKTTVKFVVNTQWPLFFEQSTARYYLLVDKTWLSASDLHGPWTQVMTLPYAFSTMPYSPEFADVWKQIPPRAVANPIIPAVFYSTVPSNVILFDGRPNYTSIPGTQLVYANNTDSVLFVYSPTQTYYYLTAGRWFSAPTLSGPWTFASMNLPADFANIPLSSPASAILSSVPGTSEAKDAVLIAQIPTTMLINPATAAAQANVTYTGNPQFAPIEGTSMQYATNTADKVIQVGDVFYLCLQGVWFISTTPNGPWTTASSVPQVIYSIPPSSPVYNVTYVTQVTTSTGYVQSSYTAGYMGAFIMGAAVGAIVASGTGYYYPPYIGYPIGGYPIYRPYPTPYGSTSYYRTSNGAYGVSQTAYGPYGSATRSASYNPYTGTSARSASVSTPYGKQSVGQAYNPYTGTYGATHQGSSPSAQWGQSYVSNGNKSATTQHYTNAYGTTASAQGSQGGKAYGTSTAQGNSFAGKTSSGDMYAGRDGNVYKNTGSGWQKSDGNGGWSNVNTTANQQKAQQSAQSYQQQHPNSQSYSQRPSQNTSQYHPSSNSMQSLDADRQSRMTGAAQSQHWGGGGGWGGGGRSWGEGGGRRR
ncbi:MAG TPA: hypothetical protein VMF56_09320 [Acidobacteriaceae bacterium]|nr:hypothetical protein [Acidobacteriaceae bacterium]